MTAEALVSEQLFEQAVRAAIRAPSMYNSQPWRFRLAGYSVEIRLDESRLLPIADPDGWAARMALGAAACNTQLAFSAAGVASTLRIKVHDEGPTLHVTGTGRASVAPRDRGLFEAISARFSHRGPFFPQAVPVPARARLIAAAAGSRAWIELLDDRTRVSRIAEILNCADATLRRDSDYAAELTRWVRADEAKGEGIAGPAAGVRPEGQDLLPMRDFGGRDRAPSRDFETDPLVAVLGTVGGTRYDDVVAGYALQRVLLTATADGLCSSMLSQAIEVPDARTDLNNVLGHVGTAQMIVRFGFGEPMWPSPRRPFDEVIDAGAD